MQTQITLTDKEIEVLELLREYDPVLIMDDFYLTGGHGKVDGRAVRSLQKKGLIDREKLTDLGRSFVTPSQAAYANMPKWNRDGYRTWNEWAKACFDAGKKEQQERGDKLALAASTASENMLMGSHELAYNGLCDAINEYYPIVKKQITS